MNGQDIVIAQLRAELAEERRLAHIRGVTPQQLERQRDELLDKYEDAALRLAAAADRLLAMQERAEKAEEMLRQARTDRDREALDRQTAQDAWNDMRRQRDAALVRAETAERFVAHADSGWKARAELSRLAAENAALQAQIDEEPAQLKSIVVGVNDRSTLLAEVERLRVEVDQLREAMPTPNETNRIRQAMRCLPYGANDAYCAVRDAISRLDAAHAAKAVKP